MSALLEIEDLKGGPGTWEILHGVSLTVGEGEVHALMGPNGSGKSTLSHCLIGRPGFTVTGGAVRLAGRDLLGLPVSERARAGLFIGHQYPIEVPGVDNREFLFQVAAAFGRTVDLDDLAARFEVPIELVGRTLNEGLSGGEKKRNELLQLAVVQPKVAVLDEIDSGLDVDALRSVARGVERMSGEGMAVLLITHYTRILEDLEADRVHVLLDGAVAESGGPELADVLEESGYAPYRGAGEKPLPGTPADDPFADPLA